MEKIEYKGVKIIIQEVSLVNKLDNDIQYKEANINFPVIKKYNHSEVFTNEQKAIKFCKNYIDNIKKSFGYQRNIIGYHAGKLKSEIEKEIRRLLNV